MKPVELNNNNGKEIFPRELTFKEKEILFAVLPENKPGYKLYRNKIEKLFVICPGRFGGNNLILGAKVDENKYSLPSSPIFAIGTIIFKETDVAVSIHEEVDGYIEVDLSSSNADAFGGEVIKIGSWNYSNWIPGEKAPNDNSSIREISILPRRYLLAIAPDHKRLWLHDYISGVNHLIPISNFYNSLMLIKNIRESKIVLSPNSFFQQNERYTDKDLMMAFLSYNKYLRKFDIDYSFFFKSSKVHEKKNLFNLFRRGKI